MHICVPCLQLQSSCLSPPLHSQTSDNLHRGGTLSTRSPLPASGLSYHHPDRAQSLWYVTLWRLFLLDSVYDRSLSSKWFLKKKSKYKSRYSEAFLNAVHDPPVTSINSTRRTIRLLNLLLSCDRPLVCSEVTGFLWLWAWSYDSSEVDGSNWKHRTALYEKDLGQVGLFSLFMYFFSFPPPPTLPNPDLLIKPDSTFKSLQWCMSRIRRLSQRELHILNLWSLILSRIFHN